MTMTKMTCQSFDVNRFVIGAVIIESSQQNLIMVIVLVPLELFSKFIELMIWNPSLNELVRVNLFVYLETTFTNASIKDIIKCWQNNQII